MKPFLTYTQQIAKLRSKGLLIADEHVATEALKHIGYFTLIGGYKNPFINPMTRYYISSTAFEDIVALYDFDKELRALTFRYLSEVEQHLRQLLSYAFCAHFGVEQRFYLDCGSYNCSGNKMHDVQKLIRILDKYANHDTSKAYLTYQRQTYGNVPLWAAAKALTFGQLSKFYALLKFQQQSNVSREFSHVNERALERYLTLLTLFRNVCAHGERLFSFRLRTAFPDTVLHRKLDISKKKGQYVQGKNDYFGLVIAFRYLLPANDFTAFKRTLARLMESYLNGIHHIKRSVLLEQMGFPSNWSQITRYKL